MKSPSQSVEETPQSTLQSTFGMKRSRKRRETRAQLLERLTNPQLTLHETSVLLGVCTATVRNYCNAGTLPHERTPGGQRRFRLRTVLAFHREREAQKKS